MKKIQPEKAGLDPRKFLYNVTTIMQIVGLLQSRDRKWRPYYLVYSSLIMLIIFVQTFTQIMEFILHSRDISTVAQNGIFTLLSINSIFKVVWLWRKQSIVLDLLADVNKHFRLTPPLRSDSKDLNIMNKRVKGAYTSFLTLTSMAYVYWLTSPFLEYVTVLYDRNRNATEEPIAIYDVGNALPAPAWYPFQVFYFPAYYVAYGFQFVSLTYIVYISTSVDLFCIVMLQRINAQLQFVVSDMEMASESALAKLRGNVGLEKGMLQVGSLGRPTPMADYIAELVSIARTCVSHHVDIIRVIRQFDKVLGGLAYMTTRLYTLVLVVGAMKIVEAGGIDANSVQLMVYWTCFLYQIYLFFSPADDIIYSQHLLGNAVETGLWNQTCNVGLNKELAYIIRRVSMMANKPAHFTAGYLRLNRPNYRTEIQQVASMFNALWQMKNSKNM